MRDLMVQAGGSYKRTFEELEQVASKFWPAELSALEAKLSVIPLLLETQDQFIHTLGFQTPDLDRLFDVIEASSLPANLFLKHLVILADFGGELLQRVSREFERLFPEGRLRYYWRGQPRSYTFRALPRRKLSNAALHIDGRRLVEQHPLDDLKKDAIALLLFGSAYSGEDQEVVAALTKCEAGLFHKRGRRMTHLSEDCRPLTVKQVSASDREALPRLVPSGFNDVCLLILPPAAEPVVSRNALQGVGPAVADIAEGLGTDAVLVTIGEVVDLVRVQAAMPPTVRYQHWIAIKRASPLVIDRRSLPHYHFGALIHTRYQRSLRHTKTRIEYTYCPACNKTTKDYGGKKHTYHHYGTLMSDVWRDLSGDLAGDLTPVIDRFRDLFGLDPYRQLLVLDARRVAWERETVRYRSGTDRGIGLLREEPTRYERSLLPAPRLPDRNLEESGPPEHLVNHILQGDCLERLREIPDDSVDFVFTDPPYNLGKKYAGYSDDLEIREYFDWCDQWIAELVRVLKPGRTLALLNIPLWAIRHFLFMDSILSFQNWIVWDALAFPVRLIMPAHYTILAFSKGPSRGLPGLLGEAAPTDVPTAPSTFRALEPLAEGYCLRSQCVRTRRLAKMDDRGPLTDLWWDIHRLKHNTRRVDHPTQLPPHLMYRLIAIFTRRGEIVLDCFNGAGTTTLAAHQLERRYIGIEKSKKYCEIARERHEEIRKGLNPFRKARRELTAKNSPVPRLPKQKYVVPKKTLQLEVKRVAQELGHLPNHEELARYGRYPIQYYDDYFISWGEVCAAARTTGMTEEKSVAESHQPARQVSQLSLGLDV